MTTTTTTDAPRIYVASLSDYNAGRLHGVWIDLDGLDQADIEEAVATMLRASREPLAEEWAIHDYEFSGIKIAESEDFGTVATLAAAITEHGPALAAYWEYIGTIDANDLADSFEEAFQGEYDSETAYAEELIEDSGTLANVPDYIARYFDYEAYARDLFMGDCWSAPASPGVSVFRSI